jgi:hypothetical protein
MRPSRRGMPGACALSSKGSSAKPRVPARAQTTDGDRGHSGSRRHRTARGPTPAPRSASSTSSTARAPSREQPGKPRNATSSPRSMRGAWRCIRGFRHRPHANARSAPASRVQHPGRAHRAPALSRRATSVVAAASNNPRSRIAGAIDGDAGFDPLQSVARDAALT